MSGLFSPNFRVLNEPRYFGRTIRTMIRCLSSCLSMVRTFAGMLVILVLSTLIATESRERLQTMYLFHFDKCICTELANRIPLDAKKKTDILCDERQGRIPANAFHITAIIKIVILNSLPAVFSFNYGKFIK